jgi:hypothetical protein
MAKAPDTIATVTDALNTQTVDLLKKLIALLPIGKAPTRKADLVSLITNHLQGDHLHQLWSQLDQWQQAAVAEVVHAPRSRFESGQFVAKYGQEPNWGTGRPGYTYGGSQTSAKGVCAKATRSNRQKF